MAANDLNIPLHRKGRAPAAPRRPVIAPVLISAALVLALVAAIWVAVVDDPNGGRPVAIAAIRDVPQATGSLPEAEPAGSPGLDAVPSVTPQDVQLAALPAAPPGLSVDPALIEPSAFGPLPRMGPDGSRPLEVYARPPRIGTAQGVPRIAIVVGGMGLSQTGTQRAVATLPEDVTLAFAPYGSSLQRWVDEARSQGHEVLLQIPLEPHGYPEENPGEHTLLASAGSEGNPDDLKWILSRITSYAGVMNYMGGRFTSDEAALVPFLGEIGSRGLFYLDDGTSAESLAEPVGQALAVPAMSADLVLDGDRSPAGIRRQLAALEAIALTQGVAIGVASAFPASIEAIAAWAESVEARGIVMVPASAALER